jgi:hypothetical protein
MGYLHRELDLTSRNVVEVSLDQQANVLLMDDTNFQHYRSGGEYTYHGGLAKRSPVRLSPRRSGRWHLVIDLGGRSGTIRHSIRVLG